jgi:hypothetical protein
MKKTLFQVVAIGALAAAASPAGAQNVACQDYRPGVFAYMQRIHPAPCPYQGDYMVQNWASYDGPAVIAPQPTYSPSPSYAYVPSQYAVQPAPVVRRTTVRRYASVKSSAPSGKGKPEIVRAQAEVRIYNRERMDIKLYRR